VTSNPAPVRLLTRSQVRSLLRWPEREQVGTLVDFAG
jgi:hypothetical protein